jgi:hypothetical protein
MKEITSAFEATHAHRYMGKLFSPRSLTLARFQLFPWPQSFTGQLDDSTEKTSQWREERAISFSVTALFSGHSLDAKVKSYRVQPRLYFWTST